MDAFRSQKHMRIHFVFVILVAVLSYLFRLDITQVCVLMISIALVLITELFNTVLEATLNLVTQTYHPVTKFAKDVAAGSVLIASLNAAAVGFCIFLHPSTLAKVFPEGRLGQPDHDPLHLTVVVVVLVMVLIVISKVGRRWGSVLRGSWLSGHVALAFCLSTCLFFLTRDLLVTIIGLVLATMVTQSRLESGVQTLRAAIYGALLGVLTTILLFVGLQRLSGL